MAGRSIPGLAVLLAVIVTVKPSARAEERRGELTDVANQIIENGAGIRTDRLSPRQLRVWKSIERIVSAKDDSGRLRHPKLHSLWRWVEASGHVIYVEMRDPKFRGDHEAGRFMVEKFDPEAQRHIAVIWLSLSVIDEALVRKRIPGADGFIQFERLGKKERYAEILGHELAHAVWTLGESDNALLVEDLKRETDNYHMIIHKSVHSLMGDEQVRERLKRIESLTTRVERPAEKAEEEVWKELLDSRVRKGRGTVTNGAKIR